MRRLLKKDRNGLKLILAILLLLIVCIFIAYFFWSWAELSDNGIALDELTSYAYSSVDGEHKVTDNIVAHELRNNTADNLDYVTT